MLVGPATDSGAIEAVAHARRVYFARRRALREVLATQGIALEPGDGINLWLPVHDERTALVRLEAAGIRVAPGTPFTADPTPRPHTGTDRTSATDTGGTHATTGPTPAPTPRPPTAPTQRHRHATTGGTSGTGGTRAATATGAGISATGTATSAPGPGPPPPVITTCASRSACSTPRSTRSAERSPSRPHPDARSTTSSPTGGTRAQCCRIGDR